MRALALLFAVLVAAPAAAAPDYAALNTAALNQHVLPRYRALVTATADFEAAAKTFCGGIRRDMAPVRDRWRGAMKVWQGVQHLRFGPAGWFNRVQRFAFWPDPRNVTVRQLGDLFAKRDPGALDSKEFMTASVAVQGLSALERVLFDEGEARKFATEPFRCEWMTAVGGNLAAMARDILADWTAAPNEFGQHFAVGGGNTAYRSPEEATLDLFKSLYTAVELVADHKLARPLGGGGKPARPQLAESWRSGTSLANINANLAAARDLFERLRPGVADPSVVSDMTARFDAAHEAAAAIGGSLEDAIADPARRPAVERLRRETLALKSLMAERLTAALGLPLGFNALDGD